MAEKPAPAPTDSDDFFRALDTQLLVHELKEPLGPVEVRQGGVAKVTEIEALGKLLPDEVGGRAREQHLAAVPSVADSRGLVHGESRSHG